MLWAGAIAVVAAAIVNVLGGLWQTKRTLAHDRSVTERSELRTVIDEAAGHIDGLTFDAINAITEVRDAIEKRSKKFTILPRRLSRRANNAIGELWAAEIEKIFAGIRRGDGFRARLEMRLGDDDTAVMEYKAALDGMRKIHRRLIDGTIHDSEGVGAEVGAIGAHMIAFRARCRDLIGTELSD